MANISAIDKLLNAKKTGVVCDLRGQKFLFYGDNGTGKTTQAMLFPKSALLMVEAGGSAIEAYKFPINTWADFITFVGGFVDDSDPEKFKQLQEMYNTIVIDTLPRLEGLAKKQVCKEYGVRDVSEITGKVNGYVLYREKVNDMANLLASKGYTVIFITHRDSEDIVDPVTGNITKYYFPKGSEKENGCAKFVRDLCDFVFYIKGNKIDPESGKPLRSTVVTRETEYCFAKTRYDLPTFMPFEAENMVQTILDCMKKHAENNKSNIAEFKITDNSTTVEEYKLKIQNAVEKMAGMYATEIGNIIAPQLPQGMKITDCTEEQRTEIETIWIELYDLAQKRNVTL